MDSVEAFLITVTSGFEANIIEAKLKTCNIPVLRKYKGVGSYLTVFMGDSNLGVDLYVPSKALELAKQLIEEVEDEYTECEMTEEEINELFGSEEDEE